MFPIPHTYTENVTSQYYDTQARLTAYQTQEARLLEMMEKAETVEDIITIEEKLTDLRYRIESLQSTLKNWDRQVSYSTISLDVEEVQEYTPETPAAKGQTASGCGARSSPACVISARSSAAFSHMARRGAARAGAARRVRIRPCRDNKACRRKRRPQAAKVRPLLRHSGQRQVNHRYNKKSPSAGAAGAETVEKVALPLFELCVLRLLLSADSGQFDAHSRKCFLPRTCRGRKTYTLSRLRTRNSARLF